MNNENNDSSVEIVENEQLSLETLENCVNYFQSIDVSAFVDLESVYVNIGYDVTVELSKNEIVFRANQYTGEES